MFASIRNRVDLATAQIGVTILACLFLAPAFAQAPPADGGSFPSGGARTITLITGDKLLIPPAGGVSVTVRPRAGRDDIVFETRHEYSESDHKDHLYVIPSDASELIASGKLDRRLFDATQLMDSHYDDGSRKDVPIIVTYQPAQFRALSATSAFAARSATVARTTVTHRLNSVSGESLLAPKASIGKLWDMLATGGSDGKTALTAAAAPVRKIWLDDVSLLSLDQSVVQIGAPTAWASGYTGAGVTVAVVDSGIDSTHPDFAGKVVAEKNFVSDLDPDVTDHFGHGTHVASIIAGTGAASGGRYRGVAPDARLISAKVCADRSCYASSIIAGFEWAVAEMGARIVNMSVSGLSQLDSDPKEEAVARLTAQYGALFVLAAGNTGPNLGSVGSPSIADAALSVAAVDRNDQVAPFSSRGPRLRDFGVKPDLSAPGVGIVAARAKGTALGQTVSDSYTAISGTSMATPHVAGAAALLKQRHPEWSAAQLKATLMGSARFGSTADLFDQGAGRLDIAAAFASSVIAEPASVSIGRVRFPHNQVVTRTVTYSNTGASDITLTLSVDALRPDGTATPAGMFTVSPATLIVPAGASALATLSLDDRVSVPFGLYKGRLIAKANGTTVSTPLSAERDEESYDLVIRHINLDGSAAQSYTTTLVPLFASQLASVMSYPGMPEQRTVRLAAGRYRVESRINPRKDAPPAELVPAIIVKTINIGADDSLTLDARAASPVAIRKPTETARSLGTVIQWEYPVSWSNSLARSEVSYPNPTFQPDTVNFDSGTEAQPGLTSWIMRQWSETTAPTTPQTDAPVYSAIWLEHDKMPVGPEKVLPLARAAVVDASYVSGNPEVHTGTMSIGAVVRSTPDTVRYPASPQPVSLPGHRREFFYTNDDQAVSWSEALDVYDLRPEFPARIETLTSQFRKFRGGAHYHVRWNEPLYGPALPTTGAAAFAPVRAGDYIHAPLFLHSDRAGHLGSVGDDDAQGQDHHYRLYRDSDLIQDLVGGPGIGVTEQVQLPPQSARYRIEAEGTQTVYGLSSRVSATWEFQSAHVEGDTPAVLPLMTVRFYPYLNASGQAWRGLPFAVPFVVNQVRPATQPGFRCLADMELSAVVTDLQPPDEGWPCPDDVSNATLDVSFDDGSSWTPVRVRRFGRLWIAPIKHPATAQFVSLRSSATDRAGNRVAQTVIRAYELIDPPSLLDPGLR